jgi:sporulation protein YlmC with PRC-barrel domain
VNPPAVQELRGARRRFLLEHRLATPWPQANRETFMFTSTFRRNALRTTALAVALLAAACAPAKREEAQVLTQTQSVAFTRDMKTDFTNGIWGTQTMTPPADLLLTKQSNLIGNRVTDSSGTPWGTVAFMMVEANQQQRPMYAVVAADGVADTYIAVPMSAIRASGGGLQVDTPVAQLNRVPKYTFAGLQARHAVASNSPPLTATPIITPAPVAIVPSGTMVAAPMVVAPAPMVVSPAPVAVMPAPESVNLSTRSDLVGRAFVDSYGNQLGTVNYVAVMPGTADARYVVVSGPMFGAGNQIFVPASQIHMSGGRVMADVPTSTLAQSQRFQTGEMQRFVVVN